MARPKRKLSESNEKLERNKVKRIKQLVEEKQKNVEVNNSVFGQLIKKSGFLFKTGNEQNELEVDQAIFQRDLRKSLKLHNAYPQAITDFLSSAKKYLDDVTRTTAQDSLIHLLLGIDILQEELSFFLLEKMVELANCDWFGICDESEKDLNLPRLILSQLRWLDTLECSKALSDKMLELLSVTPLEVQKEMITSLPDVINDQDHSEIARKLSNLLLDNQDLNVTVLDTLGSLNIKSEEIAEVRQVVMRTLSSADVHDLPIITKFILQSINPQDAYNTILELRNNLDFTTIQSISLPVPYCKSSSEKNIDFVILDAIRSAMQFQKFISDTWIKVIDSLNQTAEHKPLDFLVLLVLYSLAIHRKPIESIMRNKIRAGHFTISLLNLTFSSHPVAVQEYFGSLMIIAEIFVRSHEIVISQFGSSLYQKAFSSFDAYYKQEVIGNLVSHIGSGTVTEIDVSLDALVSLVTEYTDQMSPFGCFIKSILDYLCNLTLQQIRKIYMILSLLAYQGSQQGAFLQDDLHIVIRKQLTNNNSKYRRMGIIGALMAVKAMTGTCSETATGSSSSTVQLDNETSFTSNKEKQAISLLELVQQNTHQSPEAFALFCDELSRIIQKGELDDKIKGWISSCVTKGFYHNFTVKIEDDKLTQCDDMKLELKYGLDLETEDIALNLMPIIISAKNSVKNKSNAEAVFPITLTPLFRLLRICEQSQNNDSIKIIYKLLSCPIYLPHQDELINFGKLSIESKYLICDCMFFCLNWFREIVNAFAMTENRKVKVKVIKRLSNIVEMQNTLQHLLSETPGYVPVQANFDIDACDLPPVSVFAGSNAKISSKRKKKQTKSKKSKGKKETDESSVLLSGTKRSQNAAATENDEQNENTEEKYKENKVSLSLYSPYFRELDLDVFAVFENRFKIIDLTSSTYDEKYLSPPELCFILDDFNQKLSHILQTSSKQYALITRGNNDKKNSFSNLYLFSSSEIVEYVIHLLPSMCDLLQAMHIYFKNIVEENDGVVDGLEMFTELSLTVSHCMKLLFQSMITLLSWNGFSGENRPLLKELMKVFASRIPNVETSSLGFQDLTKYAFSYIEDFSSSLPNLDCSVMLVKLLEKFAIHSDDSIKVKLASKAETFLKQEWTGENGQRLKGAKVNDHIKTLLNVYLSYTTDALNKLEILCTVAIPELVEAKSKDTRSSTFLTLDKLTYGIYYRLIYHHLCEKLKVWFANQKITKQNQTENLMKWSLSVRIFHILVNLIKVFDGKINIACSLKYGRQFVDTFVKYGMPLLDDVFRSHHDDAQSLLKTLQLSTRFLQHVCSHSKVIRDIVLTKQVPPMKRTLETFVYRVKAMLALNKCKEAFWLGNLKNRDLKGEEILSQSSHESDEEITEILEGNESDVELDTENNEYSASF